MGMRIIEFNEKSREEINYYIKRGERLWGQGEEKTAARSEEIFGRPVTQNEAVQIILRDIQKNGDEGLCRWTAKIDGNDLSPSNLVCTDAEFKEAYQRVSQSFLAALSLAKDRIFNFHRRQVQNSWTIWEENGISLGYRNVPLERVGLYVPGGTGGNTPLVSTVLMNAVPAVVAGVKEIIMCTPPGRDGCVSPYLLVAACEVGVKKVIKAGGAQAIAAMAFGTESVPKVDKIVGPGNIFVTLAKKQVFGLVGLDMLAGPSEIVVIADRKAWPAYVAADLLSQAEHDVQAGCLLFTDDMNLARNVQKEIEIQLSQLPRAEIARRAIETNGAIIVAPSIAQCIELANETAPEHLELYLEEADQYVAKIKHAGAVFIGGFSTEPIGDYVAGTNHVLPTNGTARFSSGLNVDDFIKKISIINMSKEGFREIAAAAEELARIEGLEAHARAIGIRRK